jgi:hypothetical protein
MKHVISASVDQDTVLKLQDILRNTPHRNKSHVIEEAIKRLWQEARE